ncbi:MAG: fibronectin type III domain-containing protein, partial [Solirubrobacterales bacterium]|nr:fibronectin type III domain-containing protein [Solirubrobacterales bacterium]
GSAIVSWSAASGNGRAISGYKVTSSPEGKTCETVGSYNRSCTVDGLANGTEYSFTVVATNSAGDSEPSDPSNSVTPVAPVRAPDAVTDAAAYAGSGSANVWWSAPASNGSPITGYKVTSSPGGQTCSSPASGWRTCNVEGLKNGTAYTFTVVATNAVGDSDASSPTTAVTPVLAAWAAVDVAAAPADRSAIVSWTDEAAQMWGVISFTVKASPGGNTCKTDGSGRSCTVAGLTNGTLYTFTVTAESGMGETAESDASNSVSPVVPVTAPGAPTDVSAVAGNVSAAVSWTAPASDGGSSITAYKVTSSPGGKTCETNGAARSCSVSGLTNGTPYTFTVVATNGVGAGSASTASSAVTPATNPGAPTGVSATAGNESASVSWTAPSSTGGSSITAYKVTSSPGGKTCETNGAARSCNVSGLTNGTPYTFTVVATNGVGDGAASGASSAVTPATNPGAPTGVSAIAGNASAAVSWTAPASDGGSSITAYKVTSSPGGKTCATNGAARSCDVSGLTNGTPYRLTLVPQLV